jgi:hypothetical protein
MTITRGRAADASAQDKPSNTPSVAAVDRAVLEHQVVAEGEQPYVPAAER